MWSADLDKLEDAIRVSTEIVLTNCNHWKVRNKPACMKSLVRVPGRSGQCKLCVHFLEREAFCVRDVRARRRLYVCVCVRQHIQHCIDLRLFIVKILRLIIRCCSVLRCLGNACALHVWMETSSLKPRSLYTRLLGLRCVKDMIHGPVICMLRFCTVTLLPRKRRKLLQFVQSHGIEERSKNFDSVGF